MKNKIQIFRFTIQICSMAGLIFPFLPHPDIVGNYLFLTSIIFGVFFCGWLCPFGTIQDWINILAKKLKIPQFTMPQKLQKYLQFTRYIFAIIGSVGITFSFLNTRYYFNHNLLNRMLTFSSAITLLIFILISLFFKRPFCNYFCIKGAIDGAISVFRLFGIKKDNKKCIHCHICDKNCPMQILVEKSNFVRHPNCINCMQCITNCPKKCLKYSLVINLFLNNKNKNKY